MIEERKKFSVGVNVIVLREDKLLLGKRKNTFGAGTWGLPGGHLEEGEAMEEAAARELLEETGLTAAQLTFDHFLNDNAPDPHYLQVGFVASGVLGEPQVMEPELCEAWNWFSLDELPEVLPAHARQVDLFRNHLPFANSRTPS